MKRYRAGLLRALSLLALAATPALAADKDSDKSGKGVIAAIGVTAQTTADTLQTAAGNTVGIVTDGAAQHLSMGALVGVNTAGGVIDAVNHQPEDRLSGRADPSHARWSGL